RGVERSPDPPSCRRHLLTAVGPDLDVIEIASAVLHESEESNLLLRFPLVRHRLHARASAASVVALPRAVLLTCDPRDTLRAHRERVLSGFGTEDLVHTPPPIHTTRQWTAVSVSSAGAVSSFGPSM